VWIEGDRDRGADEASRRERWPGDAPIDFDALASAPFEKVLVRGAWRPEVVGREGAGWEFAAVCRVLAERIGGKVVVFDRSAHNPQREEPEAFNRLLRELWAA
jgi:pimeloyl-ACP methyl ester carboxylesterase